MRCVVRRICSVMCVVFIMFCINGCASKNKKVFSQLKTYNIKNDNRICAELKYLDGKYTISDYIYIDDKPKLEANVLQFYVPSFSPAFRTKRFRCSNTLDDNGCSKWEGREKEFLHVNLTKSSYGDTEVERYKARDNKPTSDELVVNTVFSPIYVAAAVVATPIIVASIAMSEDHELSVNKWVEFNHEKFAGTIYSSIVSSRYKTVEEYVGRVGGLLKSYDKAVSIVEKYENKILSRQGEFNDEMKKYGATNIVPYSFEKYIIPRKVYIESYCESELLAGINKYYRDRISEFENYFSVNKKSIMVSYRENELKCYAQLKTKDQFEEFINLYAQNDLSDSVPEAKKKLAEILSQERLEQEQIAKERRLREERIAKERMLKKKRIAEQVVEWREQVKSGDDTSYGPIIEVKQSMVRVSLRTVLPGYPADVWLKRVEIYPVGAGCLNRNGRLSPTEWPYCTF